MVDLSNLKLAPAKATDSAPALRILLAEDTQISAEAMKAMAHHLGVDIDHAENGLDAIHMIQAAQAEGQPYTLLLIDIMMPILDGVETTKRLRALGFGPDELKIVAVTAATSFDETRSYRAAGIQAFLAKPVGIKQFKAVLDVWGHETVKRGSGSKMAMLRELEEQFNQRNVQTLELIDEALAESEIDTGKVAEIRHLLHQIAGTATTFGNPQLSKTARRHENALLEPNETGMSLRCLLEEARANFVKRMNP